MVIGYTVIHLAATLGMAGLIWFVQLVHYPLMAFVGRAEFPQYERLHQRRTTWVVLPLMLSEAASAICLAVSFPDPAGRWVAVGGVGLLLMIWTSTLGVQVPAHARLSDAFDSDWHHWLVRSNWLRTLAWTVRAGLAIYMAWLVVAAEAG